MRSFLFVPGDSQRKFENAKKYHDYREMFDKEKSIDAVIISTPDHVHAVAAMAQSVVSGRYEGGILVQLPAEIFVSENI